ncbi:MAG: 4Fe-4S binding protein [bacterium]|nr:4Fe-4S binding protein [bacterium]
MNTVTRRVVLTFPANLVEDTAIYHLIKDYDLVVNILRAKIIPKEIGRIVLELRGKIDNIKKGVSYLESKGIEVKPLAQDIYLNEDKCVSCGMCLAVCHQKALSLNKNTWKIEFNRDDCILCEQCVSVCPLKVIQVTF